MTFRGHRRYSRSGGGEGYTPTKTTLSYIAKGTDEVFHPPGPGIGLRGPPAPALGRPGLLDGNHGSWKNESCFSRNSMGWKPDIMTLGTAHSCPGTKGPLGPTRPPNVSGERRGYNERMFPAEEDVARGLMYLGYKSEHGNSMLRAFQADWNIVSTKLAVNAGRYANIDFIHVPQGILSTDGMIGPQSLRALEVAVTNQRASNQAWSSLVELMRNSTSGYGRNKAYNAIHPGPVCED